MEALHASSNGSTDAAQLHRHAAPEVVAGLFRDLYGVAQATISRRDYILVFDWLYPQHFPTICKCLEAWATTPLITTPLLKFMAEFVSNKGQCMVFESSSPNGILLFREISRVLTIYNAAILQVCARLLPNDVVHLLTGISHTVGPRRVAA